MTHRRPAARTKDGRAENTHPLNRGPRQERIPLFESYLRFAEALARCSPERTHRAGCVLVSFNRERVLGAGFSGGAVSALVSRGRGRGGSHLHAEEHALLIAGAVEKAAAASRLQPPTSRMSWKLSAWTGSSSKRWASARPSWTC